MVAMYLKFFCYFQFEIIQILVILPQNAISLGIYHGISSNFSSVWGDVIYIKRVLSCDFQITPANGNIDGGGGDFERKLFVTSVYQHLLLHYLC